MGCGSIKSSTSTSCHLEEEIQVSNCAINCMDISGDQSLILLADQQGIGYLLSALSTPIELLGKLIGHQVSNIV